MPGIGQGPLIQIESRAPKRKKCGKRIRRCTRKGARAVGGFRAERPVLAGNRLERLTEIEDRVSEARPPAVADPAVFEITNTSTG